MSLQNVFSVTIKSPLKWRFTGSLAALAIFGLVQLAPCVAAPLKIVQQGKSTFSIVVPKIAAKSVNDAAAEMQHDISVATGAKLPIVKDDETIEGEFISLGSTKQAETAGVTLKGIKEEGYRLVTKAGNLYIIGIDTTAIDLNRAQSHVNITFPRYKLEEHPEIPGPAYTKNGGFSDGTANGVYSFLEEYLDVRWLMPGDMGLDIPKMSAFTIDDIDRTATPEFNYRVISLLGSDPKKYPEILAWRNQLRLGFSTRLYPDGQYDSLVPKSLYKEHPEWFAMDSKGNRPEPRGSTYKLEVTNPELVKFIAQKAIEAFKANPGLGTVTLSPTDGWGWSESPESKALREQQQGPIIIGPSVSPLILKYYTEVSDIVAKEYPQAKLAGYLYSSYAYPPSNGKTKIPDNFVPTLVSIASGYAFYKPEFLQENEKMLNEWGKIFQGHDWYYYSFATWMRGTGSKEGVITTAGTNFLNTLFRGLTKHNSKGVFFYGDSAYQQTVMANYIKAQMMWNPHADAVAIQRE